MEGFKTNRGECFIADETLHVHESAIGALKRYCDAATTSLRDFAVVFLLLVAVLVNPIYVAMTNIWFLAVICGLVIGIFVLASVFDHLRGFRRVETIPLDAIVDVKMIEGSMWTHQRFIVKFDRGSGDVHKRRIRLPSRQFSFTNQEFKQAKRLFNSDRFSAGTTLSRG